MKNHNFNYNEENDFKTYKNVHFAYQYHNANNNLI